MRKLGVKPGFRVALVNAPRNFKNELGPLPATAKYTPFTSEALDIILLFVRSELELATRFAPLAVNLSRSGMIWVAWPKKSSGVVTALSFNNVQRIGLDAGLVM